MLRCPKIALIALFAIVLTPAVAMAHSSSVETNPEHGARLERMPHEATITFSEPPKKVDVVLAKPNGKIEVLTPHVDGSTVTVELPAKGPRGDYGLSYRVVSADGHPVSGSATFTVTSGATPIPTAVPSQAPADAPAADGEPSDSLSGLAMAGGAALVALVAGVVFWLARR